LQLNSKNSQESLNTALDTTLHLQIIHPFDKAPLFPVLLIDEERGDIRVENLSCV